ncbi:Ger(x)C family spore germination protein [Alteribacillus sp. HJP-4]|uniref:Ger(x)C family spore germination protein n=1 Tax=Alteribacillus sp. HJP-4 TaxID=2775394 RepID=UPI0035CD3192
MKRLLLIICCTITLVSGCAVNTQVIDDLSLIQTVGYDIGENEKFEYMVMYPTFKEQGEEHTAKIELMSVYAKTSEQARNLLNSRAQKPLRYGQLRTIVFSSDIAEEGIEDLTSTFYRNPHIGNQIYLAVTENKTKDMLRVKKTTEDGMGVYLSDLITQNEEFESIPSTNLHQFLFNMYSDGRDAYLPIANKHEDGLEITGVALFANGKMKGKLNQKMSFVMKLLLEGSDSGTSQFYSPSVDSHVVLQNIRSSVKYIQRKGGLKPEYDVELSVQGQITDYTNDINLEDTKVMDTVMKDVEADLKKKSEEVISYMKEINSDVLGFGEKYRSRTRDWKPKQWKKEIYPDLKVNVNVKVDVLHTGAIE